MEGNAFDQLPPGTQRIETATGTAIVLSPIPTEDPNQPLVSIRIYLNRHTKSY